MKKENHQTNMVEHGRTFNRGVLFTGIFVVDSLWGQKVNYQNIQLEENCVMVSLQA